MTHQAAAAYACVAYRIMEYEGHGMSEEQLDILLDTLYDFYTEREIERIYQENIHFDSYEAIMETEEIKRKYE